MLTHRDLSELFLSTLDSGFRGRLPSRQSMLTALGGMLAHQLACTLSSEFVFYGKPKKEATTAYLAQHGIDLIQLEMGVDFAAAMLDNSLGARLFLGCESEMHPWHFIGRTIEPRHGHNHDFGKLLAFPAPVLLFVGCVSTAYLDLLARYLHDAAALCSLRWSSKWLGVIVLPSATRQIRRTLIGIGMKGSEIDFRPLEG